MIITPKRIGHFFNGIAVKLQNMGWKGMLIMSVAVILSSHPPLFGFSGSMTLIGFAYGIWPGFLIASLAALAGGAIAFFSVRLFFLDWMRRMGTGRNKQWEAFGHVMRDKGWPLVAMIRWCPLPWAIGNGLFASIDGVEFWHFMLANFLYLPRLFIPVFIGSRLNSLTDDGPENKPDPLRFILNMLSIGGSVLISIATGVWIYRLTLEQIRKLDNGEPGEGELAAEALESTALLGDYSDDEEVEELIPR
ncbi:hypothetical protein VHUM_01071 [Vanrija humicola]|uniref:Golgi apparatus membrane protein TVP38 n=1 Tax=Vanrija humicola TaxID=5417 RepID=A0A7D8V1Q0_VANHU|nr:hypothetical protein VHUM_01071 [Vanrija humicola]